MLKCVKHMMEIIILGTFSDYRVCELYEMVVGALALCLSCQHDPPGQLKLVVTTLDLKIRIYYKIF